MIHFDFLSLNQPHQLDMPPKGSGVRGRPAAGASKPAAASKTSATASKAKRSATGTSSSTTSIPNRKSMAKPVKEAVTISLDSDEEDGDRQRRRMDLDEDEDTDRRTIAGARARVAEEEDDDEEEDEEGEEDERAKIPPELITRILHDFFEQEGTRITKDANAAVASYVDIFVREAIARAASEKRSGFLEVDDLEKIAPQLLMDL